MHLKQWMSHTRFPFLALVLVALLAACAPAAAPAPTPTAAPKPPAATTAAAEPINIGFLSHSGAPSMDPFYIGMEKTVTMAEEDINAKGGVLGRKIKVIILSDQMKADQTAINVERLITRDKVVGLIGPAIFANVEVAADLAEKYKVPEVLDVAGTPELTQKGRQYLFRLGTQSIQKAQAPLEFLKTITPQPTVALVHENRSYGAGMVEPFKKIAASMGFQVVAIEPYDSTALDFKPMLLRLKGINPGAIVSPGYVNDATLLAKQSKEVGLQPKYFIGAGGGWATVDFLKAAGDAAEGTYADHEWLPLKDYPGAAEYAQRYTKEMGKFPDYQPASSYGAVYALVEAIRMAGSTDGPKMQQALAQMDYVGPYGRVKFDAQHDNPGVQIIVAQVKGGKWVGVWPDKYVGVSFP